ncbi:MAG: NERD domain-containing protein [Candidatus Aenigmarchaeota archaeon]|nr:NERD domain-containing protein [Candidatus Aenigmarchaeota archaeon]
MGLHTREEGNKWWRNILSVLGVTNTWKMGAEGEERIIEQLSRLDGYHAFHDIMLPREVANIDHIVVGRNGIFAVETKNYKGEIFCIGDEWSKSRVGSFGIEYREPITSISIQVKRNAYKLSEFIKKRLKTFTYLSSRVFVVPIVVFTNDDFELHSLRPTVKIVRPRSIAAAIKKNEIEKHYTDEEIKSIATLVGKYERWET